MGDVAAVMVAAAAAAAAGDAAVVAAVKWGEAEADAEGRGAPPALEIGAARDNTPGMFGSVYGVPGNGEMVALPRAALPNPEDKPEELGLLVLFAMAVVLPNLAVDWCEGKDRADPSRSRNIRLGLGSGPSLL